MDFTEKFFIRAMKEVSEDYLIRFAGQLIVGYLENKTPKKRAELMAMIMVLGMKMNLEDKGFEKTLHDFKKMKAGMDLLNFSQQ